VKVLFISQPNKHKQKPDFPPLGIAYLGAAAHKKGHTVKLIDSSLAGIKEVIRQAKTFSPDFIGLTCWTINRGMAWELCSFLKKALPDTFLAIGGPHASYYPEHIFAKTHASVTVIGEGEETIVELLAELEGAGDISKIKGIAWRNQNGEIMRTQDRPQIADLDTLTFPYYAGFKGFSLKSYAGLPGLLRPTAAIITSRGCVYDCTYCGSVNFWGKNWRYRSAQNVLDEIECLVKNMGARSIYIFDDNFPVNKKRALDICQGIMRRKLDIQWACCSHVKMVNEELLKAMKISGCVSIDFGVESGSDLILGNINKQQKRSDIERAFLLAHQAGIKPRAYLMVGNRGETNETIDETIEMAGIIKPHSSIGATLLWLLPGTQVFTQAREKGFINDDYWLNCDDVPYNLQEHSYQQLFNLRQRLMRGLTRQKGKAMPRLSFWLKSIYYRFPFLSRLRSFVPDWLR
jgi:anaerobic magnesium-protoporphyrin IX monomethyl ester cyclase